MPRKGPAVPRKIAPDPVYQNPLVTQLINKVLLDGKKTLSERTVYKALEIISERTANDPVITLKRAVENVRPMLEVKSRRVGGASYQVPIEVRPARGTTLALRWLVNYSRQRREHSMAERLVAEIMDASNGTGTSVKRREDMHKMAEANKAFAHYRWGSTEVRSAGPRARPFAGRDGGAPDGGPGGEDRRGADRTGRQEERRARQGHVDPRIPARPDAEHRHHGAHRRR
jgi:small subunit ribosomal protein S7